MVDSADLEIALTGAVVSVMDNSQSSLFLSSSFVSHPKG